MHWGKKNLLYNEQIGQHTRLPDNPTVPLSPSGPESPYRIIDICYIPKKLCSNDINILNNDHT